MTECPRKTGTDSSDGPPYAACALHPKPWKIHARREGSASVQVISYATREARDASVSWYEHTGYIVQTSGPK